MSRLTFFIPLLLALNFVSLSQGQSASGSSPSLVIHLFRHGARAPLHDTYAPDWSEYELGELTPVGQREHYLIGTALAEEYPDILGQPYNLSKIYLRSSTLHRSVESAQAQLYGVYEGRGPALSENASYPTERAEPPFVSAGIQQKNQQLNISQAIPGGFLPIPANTTSDEGGITLLEPTQVCFNLIDNIIENVLDDESIQLWQDLEATRQTLDDAGVSVNNPYDLGTLGDALVCDYYDNRVLPGNIDPNSDVYKNVTFARNWYFMKALWGAEQQRQHLSVPLFNYILKYLDAKVNGNTTLEFMFLSSAETNLIDLLATLGILNPDCLKQNYLADLAGQPKPNINCNFTEFASSILVEFYDNNGSPTVIFKYNNVPLPICSGQAECSYDDFKNLINENTDGYTPDEYQDDCLGRTIPEFQKIFEKAGAAFEQKVNGVDQSLDDIKNEIFGDDSNGGDSGDNGGDGGIVDSVGNAAEDAQNSVDNAVQGAQNQVDNAVQGAQNQVDQGLANLGDFIGGNGN